MLRCWRCITLHPGLRFRALRCYNRVFCCSLPLEKKFPPPFDAAWLSLSSAKPEVTPTRFANPVAIAAEFIRALLFRSKFVSKAEREQKQEEKRRVDNEKERSDMRCKQVISEWFAFSVKEQKNRLEQYATVFMSEPNRMSVYRCVRSSCLLFTCLFGQLCGGNHQSAVRAAIERVR